MGISELPLSIASSAPCLDPPTPFPFRPPAGLLPVQLDQLALAEGDDLAGFSAEGEADLVQEVHQLDRRRLDHDRQADFAMRLEPGLDLLPLVAAAMRDQPVVLGEAPRQVIRQAEIQQLMCGRVPIGVDPLSRPVRAVLRQQRLERFQHFLALLVTIGVPDDRAEHAQSG